MLFFSFCRTQCAVSTFAGGYAGDGYLSSTYRLSGKTWTRLPDMEKARWGHSCQLHQGELVLMGGYDGVSALTSVEILNLATNEWRRGAALPSKVSDGHSTVYEDTLYLIDSDSDYGSGSVYSLSPGTSQWKVVANIGKTVTTRLVFPAPRVSSDVLGC